MLAIPKNQHEPILSNIFTFLGTIIVSINYINIINLPKTSDSGLLRAHGLTPPGEPLASLYFKPDKVASTNMASTMGWDHSPIPSQQRTMDDG